MDLNENVSLYDLYIACESWNGVRRTKTFTGVIRDKYDENFSSRYIKKKYSMSWESFIDKKLEAYLNSIPKEKSRELAQAILRKLPKGGPTRKRVFSPFEATVKSGKSIEEVCAAHAKKIALSLTEREFTINNISLYEASGSDKLTKAAQKVYDDFYERIFNDLLDLIRSLTVYK